MVSSEEKAYLRALAKQVADVASDSKWKKKRQEWIDLNNLKGKRTMITTYLNSDTWKELIPRNSLRMTDPLLKSVEYELKKRLYRSEHFADDMLVDTDIYVPIDYDFTNWVEGRVRPYCPGSDGVLRSAEAFHPVLIEVSDIKKLRKPELKYINWSSTNEKCELLGELLGDILKIHRGLPFSAATDCHIFGWGMSMVDVLAELRGLEQLYFDIYDEPEFLDDVLSFMQEGYLDYLETMEKEGLLCLNNSFAVDELNGSEASACGENALGLTDDLPRAEFDGKNVTAKDIWGYVQLQEYEPVGPHHRYAFGIKYQIPIAERFGRVAYGCCENNDYSYQEIFKLPNLHTVSVPYVSNLQLAADTLKDYVMCWRPMPKVITLYDEKTDREFIRNSMEIMQNNNSVYNCTAAISLEGHPEKLDEMISWVSEYSHAYARR